MQKSVARLGYNDYLALPEGERAFTVPQVPTEDSYFNKVILEVSLFRNLFFFDRKLKKHSWELLKNNSRSGRSRLYG